MSDVIELVIIVFWHLIAVVAAVVIVALLTIATPAQAEPLSNLEKGFIVNMTAGLVMALQCGAKPVPRGADLLGDKNGVDTDRLFEAFAAAVSAQGNLPYDRSKLIPEVTQTMNATFVEIQQGLQRDKAKTCAKWSKAVRDNGLIE